MPGPLFSGGIMTFTNANGDVVSFSVLQGYVAVDTEITSGTSYYGFVDPDGNWYIMRGVITGNATHYDFFKGTSAFATNWGNRTTLVYDEFDTIF